MKEGEERLGMSLAPAAVLSRIAATKIGWEHQPVLRTLGQVYGTTVLSEREELAVDLAEKSAEEIFSLCDSPIEELMLAHLANRLVFIGHELSWEKPKLKCERDGPVITAQAPVGGFVLDFLVEHRGKRFAIECDGHEYHDRTRQQVAKDKQRDRRVICHGVETLRFSGSEIWNNGIGCSWEIINAFGIEDRSKMELAG